jgi:hypothetical protein
MNENTKNGTVANPVVCHEWPAAFDICRERNRPIVARVGDEVGRCFPSGKFEALNSPALKSEPHPPSLLDAAKAALTRLEVLESKHAQHLSTWGVRRRSDPPEIVALRAAIAKAKGE